MEVLVRWKCFCQPPRESCHFCQGNGHIDRWMPTDFLVYLRDRTYLILGRRRGEARVA